MNTEFHIPFEWFEREVVVLFKRYDYYGMLHLSSLSSFIIVVTNYGRMDILFQNEMVHVYARNMNMQ